MFLNQSIDGSLVQRGENLYVTLGILVCYVQPELVECVRACAIAIEPDISLFSLTKLATV